MSNVSWKGRFAPSPTGALHFGSLLGALASYLDARKNNGTWLVRIDDLDKPREQPDATGFILRILESIGLEWNGPVIYQSDRLAQYEEAYTSLIQNNLAFRCACSRRAVIGRAYPGTCREASIVDATRCSTRVLVEDRIIAFEDGIQGKYEQNLAKSCGDFIIRRSDGIFAYNLAVVVDDAIDQVTSVVRGLDLLDSTPRQLWLMKLLNLPYPEYAHIPLALDMKGIKLSKQTFAPPLVFPSINTTVFRALQFLGLAPPEDMLGAPSRCLLDWAESQWEREAVLKRSYFIDHKTAANIALKSS
jgi:glutamyl-Q tRNA(Asp) synthetase